MISLSSDDVEELPESLFLPKMSSSALRDVHTVVKNDDKASGVMQISPVNLHVTTGLSFGPSTFSKQELIERAFDTEDITWFHVSVSMDVSSVTLVVIGFDIQARSCCSMEKVFRGIQYSMSYLVISQ